MSRVLRAAALVAVATVAGALSLAGAAAAHVAVEPSGTAEQGGDVRIAFWVPNETDNTDTTKVEVHLPTDHPIASVAVQPVPGWTIDAQKTTLATPIKSDDGEVTQAVTVIIWTADANAGIKPGQFQEFPVALEGLPDTATLVFKTLQTYSDGSVVRWIDDPTPNGQEPEHPAPVLTLAKAGSGDADEASGSTGDGTAASGKAAGNDATAIALGVAGLVAGLAGLALGLVALLRTRRGAGSPPAAA
jgi:periplasmic copper chaperone A